MKKTGLQRKISLNKSLQKIWQ